MKIGVVAPEFPPALGGMEIYAFEICRELARRGHAITVFTRRHPQGEVEIPGVEVLPVLVGKSYRDWRTLQPQVGRFDFLHVMNAAYSWLALRTAPVVVSVYGNDFLNPNPVVRFDLKGRFGFGDRLDHRLGQFRTRRTLDQALHRVNHVITISQFSADIFLEMFPQCRQKTTIAWVGVSEDFFDVVRPPRPAAALPRLLTVCRLSEERKNVDVVIRALATLKDRFAFEYHVVGDGPLRPKLEALAAECSLADRVRFHGSVSTPALREQLALADLFILTSALKAGTVEGFGIVYLEANAVGTPCMAARLGGAAEAVEEGVGGFFVEQPTVEQVAAGLGEFLAGGHRYTPEACRESARRFRWKNVVDTIVEHYPSVPASVR